MTSIRFAQNKRELMLYNVKNVVGLIGKSFPIIHVVFDYVCSSMGEVGRRRLLFQEYKGIPVDIWQNCFGVKGR